MGWPLFALGKGVRCQMKLFVFFLAFVFCYNAFADARSCAQLQRAEAINNSLKLKIREFQTAENLPFQQSISRSMALARGAKPLLDAVDLIYSTAETREEIASLNKFFERADGGHYGDDFKLSFLKHALPRIEGKLNSAIFNAQLAHCPADQVLRGGTTNTRN